uniref:Uncharacterized protein n=1 Tax=Mola mola TaxID=94237 RepID=A0A3Q3XQL5_MOLML
MNSEVYRAILSAYIQPNATKLTERCLTVQMDNDPKHTSAVYVNIAQLRQSVSESPLSCSPSYLDPQGWEVHVDQESGQEYYYHPTTGQTTWDNPFLDSPIEPEALPVEEPCSPSPPLGHPYFYNPVSGETSWEPPEQLSPYPHLMEPMSVHRFHEDEPVRTAWLLHLASPSRDYAMITVPLSLCVTYLTVARHSFNCCLDFEWIKSVDERGQTYYYLRDGSKSQWNLPAAPGRTMVENGVEADSTSVIKNWRHTMGPVQLSSEKAGILNKTKVSENGKKVRKNWTQTWTVLLGGILTFHKDPKSAATGTNQIVPEFMVDLRGATISWASKDKSSKKNVLELKTKSGVEFLIQYDTESIISDWHKVLTDTIRQLVSPSREDEDVDLYEKIVDTVRDDRVGDGNDKVRTKLMKFLMKRPTLQSVKEKGYIRDNVFGCHLATLCSQERTTVPHFVEKCIKAVERRGLDIDGLYRVSGNLAIIQKLRFKADHEDLDLEDGQWEDVHVITGALKLFFRELPEPLFPYSHFNKFVSAIRIADYHTKLSCIYELVQSLPPSNHDTMKLLFGHLRRVIHYGDDNRMTVQNVAIVFGPTLLRPEMESANITMHMVFQNQIVEFILNEYERIFYSS